MPRSVVYKHLKDSKHDESFQYIDDLVKQFSSPENIVRSKIDRNTKIYNIRLINRNHEYLIVVVRYSSFFGKLIDKKNFIVTFYPYHKPKEGVELWHQ